jgi:DNA-binding LacI/PurR family transcriptional regulator
LAGIDVPRRLSIISFDNLAETETVPITTVDFGFQRLGYLSIHAVIGDIPVPADRNGNIAGVCSLVSRGGVGPPCRNPAGVT